MRMNKKIVVSDDNFIAFKEMRRAIPEKTGNLIALIEKLKKINAENKIIVDFIVFLEDLLLEKYGRQRNNHHFMKTFLNEKVKTHKRILFDLVDIGLENGKIPYAKNLSPKTIMSNYFFSNEMEERLNVSRLEKSFIAFTRGDRVYLNKRDDFIRESGLTGKSLIGCRGDGKKLNDELAYENELEDLKDFFALQLTRREFFLQYIAKACLSGMNSKKVEDLDLLDYMYIKYIYNKTIPENYAYWQESLRENNVVYQIQYRLPRVKKTYRELRKDIESGIQVDSVPHNLAITEAHTLRLVGFIELINHKCLKVSMRASGFRPFTKKELRIMESIIVTVGSEDKLCFLMKNKVSNILLEKINFIIHSFWDEVMANAALLNLLLSKNSNLNLFLTLKNTPQANKVSAIFMRKLLRLSQCCEDVIKRESIGLKCSLQAA